MEITKRVKSEEEEELEKDFVEKLGRKTTTSSTTTSVSLSHQPIPISFASSFSNVYNLAAKKNLRCFPNCCKEGHLDKSFCGCNIDINVDVSQPFSVESSFLIGEFTTTRAGPSLRFGQYFDPIMETSFTIRPPRKWQLAIGTSKVKFYTFQCFLIVDQHVRYVLSSPEFEVKFKKRERRTPTKNKMVQQGGGGRSSSSTGMNIEEDDDEEDEEEEEEQREEEEEDDDKQGVIVVASEQQEGAPAVVTSRQDLVDRDILKIFESLD